MRRLVFITLVMGGALATSCTAGFSRGTLDPVGTSPLRRRDQAYAQVREIAMDHKISWSQFDDDWPLRAIGVTNRHSQHQRLAAHD
jgi:hypothetical protein